MGAEAVGQVRAVIAEGRMAREQMARQTPVLLHIALEVQITAGTQFGPKKVDEWGRKETFGLVLRLPPGVGKEYVHGVHTCIGDSRGQPDTHVVITQPQIRQTPFLQASQRQAYGLRPNLVAQKNSVGPAGGAIEKKVAASEADLNFKQLWAGDTAAEAFAIFAAAVVQGKRSQKWAIQGPLRQEIEIGASAGVSTYQTFAGLPFGVEARQLRWRQLLPGEIHSPLRKGGGVVVEGVRFAFFVHLV